MGPANEADSADPAPFTEAASVAPAVSDETIREALGGLASGRTHYYLRRNQSYGRVLTTASLQGVVAGLAGHKKKGLLSRIGLGAKKLNGMEGIPESPVDWSPVVGGLGALALRAGLVTTSAESRSALAALLSTVAETPLAESDGHWRFLRLTPQSGTELENGQRTFGFVLPTKGGRAMVLSWNNEYIDGAYRGVLGALEYVSEPGNFGPVPGFFIASSREGDGWGGADRLREHLRLLAAHGPAAWRPESVDQLAGATGITRAEAALLLAGLVGIDRYENNFLAKPVREMLGLKVAEAKTAKDSLSRRLTAEERVHLLSLAMPDNPADLWEKGPDVARLAEGWNRRFGRQVPLPDTLVADFAAARKGTWKGAREPVKVLQGMVSPDSTPWLSTDLSFRLEDGRLVHEQDCNRDGDDGFHPSHLADTVVGLLWLAYRLPLGDPIRPLLPRVYEALQQRLANPVLLLPIQESEGGDVAGLRQVYGLPPVPKGNGWPVEILRLGDAGFLLSRPWASTVYLRPSRLDSDGEPILRLAEAVPDSHSAPLLIARSAELAGLIDELRGEGAASGWAQDPLVSAPELVAEGQARLDLGPDAARLYLQLLALPDPTDKNVRMWNGWTPKVFKAATAALLEAGLVVEGKRARAGRSVFLPSAWLPVKAPGVPVEAWKVPLLGLSADGSSPLDLAVPVTSVRELYRRAWQRVLEGDGPRMDTLETGRQAGRR